MSKRTNMSENTNAKKDKRSVFKGDYREIAIAGIVLSIAVAIFIAISVTLHFTCTQVKIYASVINSVSIVFISTIATLIGLYVTAFIFLNDSLKERVKEDATIGDAVNAILNRYRKNMVCIAIVAIIAIAIGVVFNLIHDSAFDNLDAVKLSLVDPRWIAFLIYVGGAITVITWIILCSRDITDSDKLIFRYSQDNRDNFRKEIVKDYNRIVSNGNRLRARPFDNDDWIKTATGDKILNAFAKKEYEYTLGDAYKKALKDGDIISKSNGELDSETFGRYEIELGKIVRLLENMIGRISDNNIDKSIMNNEYRIKSLQNGFMWLYAQGNSTAGKKGNENLIDVRDSKRFLDHIKYQIITDPTFETRPFNNSEVEGIFDRVSMAFEKRQFADGEKGSGKRTLIAEYKANTATIIGEFFDGYHNILGYRDAMVHLTHFEDKDDKEKPQNKDLRIDNDIVSVLNYAIVLKRVLLDRFMSFVRTDDLSLGNSTMDKGWFNYSELTKSNFTHSSFKYACIENAIARDCDLSTCSFVLADASNTDFSDSNFSYSDLTGMDLTEANLSRAQMNSVILRDQRIDTYAGMSELLDVADKDEGQSFQENKPKFAKVVSYIGDRHGKRIEWFKNLVPKNKNADATGVRRDKNEQRRDKRELLRNAEVLKHLGGYLMGDFGDELKGVSPQNDESVTILKYDSQGAVIGSVLNDSYNSIMGKGEQEPDTLAENRGKITDYLLYRKYSKIDKELFDNLDNYRIIEGRSKLDDGTLRKDRRESGFGKVYFRVATMKNATVNEVTMPNTDFSFVDISSASFKDSDLSYADMYYTNADNAMFAKTNLSSLDSYKACYNDANFSESSLIGSNFVDCALNSVNFKKALMLNCILVKSREACEIKQEQNEDDENTKKLTEEPKKKVELTEEQKKEVEQPIYLIRALRSKFETRDGTGSAQRLMAEVEGTKMVSSILRFDEQDDYTCFDSDFSEALASHLTILNLNMLRSKFVKADMSSAVLYNCALMYSDMHLANLSNAIVAGCAFHQADCHSTNLQKAVLYACEFANASFKDATINAAIVTRCNFDQTNLNGANFSRSRVNNCSFVNCAFDKINLAGTIFKDCIFCDIDFSTAIGLDEVQFINCAFQRGISVEKDDQLELIPEKAEKQRIVLDIVAHSKGKVPRYSRIRNAR